ncbi:MAG: hypothetical protein C4291_06585 [Candidatus Dadabacteria bacterium]
MLKVDRKAFERVIIRSVGVTDVRELAGEFSKDRIFFCSLLKDISNGKDSPNYHVLREIARDIMLSEQFIVEQAKFVLSAFAPDEPSEDYYKILNVSHTASADEIRKSWINLVKTYHPDKVGDRGLDITKRLNEAYEVLGNPVKRSEYEAKRLPTMPVVVIGHSISTGSKRLMYSASLSVVILAVIFYVAKSGLFFRAADEKGEFAKKDIEPLPTEVISDLDMKKLPPPRSQKEKVSVSLLPSPKGKEKTITSKEAIGEIPEEKEKIIVESREESRLSILKKTPSIETKREEKKEEAISLPKAGKVKKTAAAKQEAKLDKISKGKKDVSEQKPRYVQITGKELEEEKSNVSSPSSQEIKPSYDKDSLYSFVSDYASAYKSRDMNLFMSFFEPDARENGIEVSRAISSYKKNFSSLEIIEYDIRIKSIDFRDNEAFVNGSFVILFRNKNDKKIRNSDGVINWALLWQEGRWRIKELNYVIKD